MKYVLPLCGDAQRLVMIKPGQAFDSAWRTGDPDHSDVSTLSRVGLEQTRKEITNDPKTVIRVPEIAIDIEDGKPRVSFIDGRSRVTALRGCGHNEIPVLVSSNVSLEELCKLPWVEPVPEKLRRQILEGEEGDDLPNRMPDKETLNIIRRWAKENAESLLLHFKKRGFGLIAGDLLRFYQEHGKMPPKHEIDRMMKQALEQTLDRGQQVEVWIVRRHAHLLDPARREMVLTQADLAEAEWQKDYSVFRAAERGESPDMARAKAADAPPITITGQPMEAAAARAQPASQPIRRRWGVEALTPDSATERYRRDGPSRDGGGPGMGGMGGR